MGGSPRVDNPTNPNEICTALADRCGGRAEGLYAPAYVENAEMRDRLLREEAVAHTRRFVEVHGDECLSLDEIARLRDAGAVGDVLGNYVDVRGTLIVAPHSHRLIALSIEDLLRIGTVVAVASEREKPLAILGALRAGVIDVLIVDEGNARAVLEVGLAAPRDDAAPRSIQLEPAR